MEDCHHVLTDVKPQPDKISEAPGDGLDVANVIFATFGYAPIFSLKVSTAMSLI